MITQTDSCRKRSHNPSVSFTLSLPPLLIVTQHLILGSFSLCVMTTQMQRLEIHITSGKVRDGEPERHRHFDYSWLLFFCLSGVLLSPLSSYNCFLPVTPLFISSTSLRDVLVSWWTEMTVPLWSPDSLQLLKAHRRALLQLCNNWAVLFLVFLISAYLLGLFKIPRLSGDS